MNEPRSDTHGAGRRRYYRTERLEFGALPPLTKAERDELVAAHAERVAREMKALEKGMIPIRFIVPCIPVAQPRQRHRIAQSADGRQWVANYTERKHPANAFKAAVQLAASEAYQGPPLTGALSVGLVFVLPRPGRLVWKSRPMPRRWHDWKPDAENLAKSAVDALTGTLWRDDAQVARLVIEKHVAAGDEQPHAEVTVAALVDQQAATTGPNTRLFFDEAQ
jgi:Holliday junction resolvase RusA-like endonuclease